MCKQHLSTEETELEFNDAMGTPELEESRIRLGKEEVVV